MKTKISLKNLIFLKNSLILITIQILIAGTFWLICDILGVYLTTYYIDIDQNPPFIREWENGVWKFFKYIIETFVGMAIFWGLPFIINSIFYLKCKNSYYLILYIPLGLFLYTYIIFIYMLNIYFWNELYRLMHSTIIFCVILLLKNFLENR